MKKTVMTVLTAGALLSCGTSQQQAPQQEQPVQTTQTPSNTLEYPETRKGNTVDTYFGTEVKDPYRWLEDDRSPETEAWVKAQNEVTFGYLEQIPFRETLKNRLTELWNYEKISAPWKEGDLSVIHI